MLNRVTSRAQLPKYIFQVLVFLLPTQLGYHFWPNWAYVFGIRVDYFAPTIYLTDLLVILFIVLSFSPRNHGWEFSIKKLLIFLIVLLVGILNIVYAKNFSPAVIKLIKIVELTFLGYFISTERKFDLDSWLIKPLILSVIVFSLIGIGQTLLGHTLGGPIYFLGEREFDIQTSGIALFNLFGREYLRAYSTFSHPNSLAGFIGASLILIYTTNLKARLAKTWRVLTLMLGTIVFIFANSQGAYLSLFFVLIIYFIYGHSKTFTKKIIKLAFFASVVLSLLLPIVLDKFNFLTLAKSEEYVNRLVLAKIAGQIFSKNPVNGVGLNNFIYTSTQYSSYSQVTWLLQPVHNIYLLVISEVGFLGLTLFLLLLYLALMRLTTIYSKNSIAVVLTIIFIISTGLFDHYWLTLQQNQLMFSLVLGLSFRKN